MFVLLVLVPFIISSPVAASSTGSAPAQAAGYEVICVLQTLPGGKQLPKVCVPDPLS